MVPPCAVARAPSFRKDVTASNGKMFSQSNEIKQLYITYDNLMVSPAIEINGRGWWIRFCQFFINPQWERWSAPRSSIVAGRVEHWKGGDSSEPWQVARSF